MTNENPQSSSQSANKDNSDEGPDIEKPAPGDSVIDDIHDELNDSADSYISPARTGES